MAFNLSNRTLRLPGSGKVVGTGWLPPTIDPRDYTEEHAKIKPMALKFTQRAPQALPPSVDLRAWCSPIEDQGHLGSCTAHAALGVVEYGERRAHGKHLDGSRLFVYKATRNLLGVTGDTGAWLRNAMGALALCGVPAERYWPYVDTTPEFDAEPTQFVYAVANNYQALRYFAHDPLSLHVPRVDVLKSVKKYLSGGLPSMFGFWGYPSFHNSDQPGNIPFPTDSEVAGDPEWGHAVVAVGYDDARQVKNTLSNQTTTGALLIRNSWGTDWGMAGYGWLPYEYVLKGIALDFWSLLKMDWVDTGQFFEY